MDNFEAMRCVLQMAKAWQDFNVEAGFVPNQYDDEAIVKVESMLEEIDDEA